MSLQFSLDFDFSSGYIKKQLENINTLCNAVINAKMIQEKIEDKEFNDNYNDNDNIPTVVEKKKSKKKSKSKIVNTKINLLELPDDDEKEKAEKKVIIVEPSLPKLELPLLQPIPEHVPKVEEKIVSSTKINCICGSSYIKRNEKRHLGTKAHIEFLTLNPNLKK